MSATEEARRQAALAEEARRRGIAEWELEASRAVPDDLVRSIVDDFRRGPSLPSSMAVKPRTEGPPRGSWGTGDTPLRQPPGIDLIDRMVKVQDALNAAQKVQELSSLLAVSKRSEKMK